MLSFISKIEFNNFQAGYQLPPPPPPKPPPEDPPPPEELLEGELTIVDFADAMLLENELEKLFMVNRPVDEEYQSGGCKFSDSNFLAHLSNMPNARA